MGAIRTPFNRRLYALYKQFTHGGLFWRDQYLLERWDKCTQRVVYRDDTFHGYKILRRLGNWCWLTRDPHTGEFLTMKFLPRGDVTELDMWRYLQTQCSSLYVVHLRDHFKIGHHLGDDPDFQDISFETVVYPTTGSSLERAFSKWEQVQSADLPFSVDKRQTCVHQIVCGMADLHRIGVIFTLATSPSPGLMMLTSVSFWPNQA
ncbi:Protein kinase-like domain protein [Metarhizium rileyi]|uniref:Protein kinase-like domain protein n=1 Tax=Metarhizium rileyi (strain RCEF 4871) TaxID=1649241 RepID=A0A167DAR9_METRR|nr:Protein kinase-like domain protein [Metarhizium rileyi RCEF 4871]